MTRGKQIRRMIAMAMVAAMTMSSMSIVAFAEDGNASTASESNNSESGGFGDGGSDNSGTDNGGSDNISPVTSGEESVAKDGPINITISIPSEPDDPETKDVNEGQNTETFGSEEGSVSGDLPDAPDDQEYDYEITTQQGSVTVTTENSEITTEYGENDLDYISSDTTPTDENDLYREDTGAAPDQFQPGYEESEGRRLPVYF